MNYLACMQKKMRSPSQCEPRHEETMKIHGWWYHSVTHLCFASCPRQATHGQSKWSTHTRLINPQVQCTNAKAYQDSHRQASTVSMIIIDVDKPSKINVNPIGRSTSNVQIPNSKSCCTKGEAHTIPVQHYQNESSWSAAIFHKLQKPSKIQRLSYSSRLFGCTHEDLRTVDEKAFNVQYTQPSISKASKSG